MAVNKEPGLDAHIAKVLERIGEVSLAMRRKQATDLSLLQLRILGFVKDHAEEQVGVARLAEELQVSKPTISDSVKLLVDRKRLVRIADKGDARAHNLKITTSGMNELAPQSPLDKAVSVLSADDKKAMMLGLLGILEGLFSTGDMIVQRMCWTCKHYRGDKKNKHRCMLLQQDLSIAELRTDCPEHDLGR